MKNLLLLGLVAVVALGSLLYLSYTEKEQVPTSSPNITTTPTLEPETTDASSDTPASPNSDRRSGTTSTEVATGKLKVINFTGTLEKVDTGCFADGECFVEVGGKHITTTIGWSQAVVGTIEGVPSFGDLESHIGEQVDVYAKDTGDGTYSLYGSEGFYVRLK